MSIIDTTIGILKTMGLDAMPVTAQRGYVGVTAQLPNDAQAFFVWSKMNEDDFHFQIARFWQSDNPFSIMAFDNLPSAIENTRILITSN
jgi:hypothetical protein